MRLFAHSFIALVFPLTLLAATLSERQIRQTTDALVSCNFHAVAQWMSEADLRYLGALQQIALRATNKDIADYSTIT